MSEEPVVYWRRSIALVLSFLAANVKRERIISMVHGMDIKWEFFLKLVMTLRDLETSQTSLQGHCVALCSNLNIN